MGCSEARPDPFAPAPNALRPSASKPHAAVHDGDNAHYVKWPDGPKSLIHKAFLLGEGVARGARGGGTL
jgi:hypothetical protein